MAFGDYSDVEALEYRMRKELQFGDVKRAYRQADTSVKHSVRTSVGFVDIYLYYPQQNSSKISNGVTVFNFHGGGYVLRDWELDIPYCQLLADESGSMVINVDYVVGPEHRFPVPQLTTFEVISYCSTHRDDFGIHQGPFAVCGHSAGGNLAAALCELAAGDDGVSIAGLIMDYPSLCSMTNQRVQVDSDCCISSERMEQYATWAFENERDLANPLASPMFADDVAWPPTLINAAGLDSLLPDSIDFARQLERQGVEVDLKIYDECMHGFTHKNFLREYDPCASEDAWSRISFFIKKLGGELNDL